MESFRTGQRAVIIGGAEIRDYERVRSLLRPDDFLIFCDSGLYHKDALGVRADLIIGDFDSHPQPADVSLDCPETTSESPAEDTRAWVEPAPYHQVIRHTRTANGTELIILPHMKDDTDTFYAAKEAARRGFRDVLLLGASGGRPDLYFSNVSILYYLALQGIECWLADDVSRMRMLIGAESRREAQRSADSDLARNTDTVLNSGDVPDSVRYFSLIPYNGPAQGVTVTGAVYPLSDAVLVAEHPFAVSNEVLPGDTVHISLRSGSLLLILVES